MALALLGFVRSPAAGAMEKVRVEYAAPSECPDAAAFKSLVGSRLATAWEAEPSEFARRVVVQLSRSEAGYTAKVELTNEAGELAVKTVSGNACADVVDGIALVTALAIQSQGNEVSESGEPAEPGPAAAAPEDARLLEPPPPLVRSGKAEAEVGGVPKESAAERPAEARTRTPIDLRVALRGEVSTGVGPSAALGVGLGLVLQRGRARLGLALEGLRTARTDAGGVPARFERRSARLEACPFTLDLAERLTLEPCPFAEIGALTGEAFEAQPTVVRGGRGSSLWLAAGGFGRVVGTIGWLVLEAGASVGFPLRRERFYIERGDEVHRVPVWYVTGAAGVGVRF